MAAKRYCDPPGTSRGSATRKNPNIQIKNKCAGVCQCANDHA